MCGDLGALVIPNWTATESHPRRKSRSALEEEIIHTKAGPTKTMAPRAKNTIEEIAIDGHQWHPDYGGFYRNLADHLDGNAELRVKPEEAMRVMRVMEAAFESHRTRSVVKCSI